MEDFAGQHKQLLKSNYGVEDYTEFQSIWLENTETVNEDARDLEMLFRDRFELSREEWLGKYVHELLNMGTYSKTEDLKVLLIGSEDYAINNMENWINASIVYEMGQRNHFKVDNLKKIPQDDPKKIAIPYRRYFIWNTMVKVLNGDNKLLYKLISRELRKEWVNDNREGNGYGIMAYPTFKQEMDKKELILNIKIKEMETLYLYYIRMTRPLNSLSPLQWANTKKVANWLTKEGLKLTGDGFIYEGNRLEDSGINQFYGYVNGGVLYLAVDGFLGYYTSVGKATRKDIRKMIKIRRS